MVLSLRGINHANNCNYGCRNIGDATLCEELLQLRHEIVVEEVRRRVTCAQELVDGDRHVMWLKDAPGLAIYHFVDRWGGLAADIDLCASTNATRQCLS